MEPVPYTFVSVNRRNIEARVHIAMWDRASPFSRFTDTNVYGTGFVKLWKTPQNVCRYTDIFVRCGAEELLRAFHCENVTSYYFW